MTINATLGLMDFLDYFMVKLDGIMEDDKLSWRDVPKIICILQKVKLAIVGVKNMNEELTHSTDEEMTQVVMRLQGVTQKIADLIVKHQVVHTSTDDVDMEGFSEEAFRQALADAGLKAN
jgi:hypothetical protein